MAIARRAQEADLAQIIDHLLTGWTEFVSDDGPALREWRDRTDHQVATLMTLTAHVHQTATILRSAMPDALTIAHVPLVRAIYEATITAVWCDEVADGAMALVNEGIRQRRNLRSSLADTRTMAQIADQIVAADLARMPTSSDQQARSFEGRCDDVALDGAYAYYRMLSGLSHVSIDTIDAYLDGDSFRPGEAMSVKSNPGPLESSHAWSHLVASCLVWSGMVTNYMDTSRTRRSELRRAARALGIAPELAVKYRAHVRGRSAGRS